MSLISILKEVYRTKGEMRNNYNFMSLIRIRNNKTLFLQRIFMCIFVLSIVAIVGVMANRAAEDKRLSDQQKLLQQEKLSAIKESEFSTAGITNVLDTTDWSEEEFIFAPEVLPEYQSLYKQNNDMIGWLKIEDTKIDYPVMQTPEDEGYYLDYDFYGEENSNGCLIMDTDSTVGSGTALYSYTDGSKPSTNLIIHGHTMKSGMMFGDLELYEDEIYGKKHNLIQFDSLYEKRDYEVIAVFYSQVYMNTDEVFKYYKFFQADSGESFEDFYINIKNMSMYDTGVTAEYGDEFITLSCCSYQVEDGRFVVVGKRIK